MERPRTYQALCPTWLYLLGRRPVLSDVAVMYATLSSQLSAGFIQAKTKRRCEFNFISVCRNIDHKGVLTFLTHTTSPKFSVCFVLIAHPVHPSHTSCTHAPRIHIA